MLKKLIKELVWYLQGGYKPREFWDNWTEEFMKDAWQVETHEQHPWILQRIKTAQAQPESILEIGCGFGRNIKYLIANGVNPSSITGVDISPNMIKRAKSYINDKRVTLMVADVKKLPFSDKKFDLVLLHGVFMHIQPKHINAAIYEAIRVAKKYLITIDQNYGGNNYTFVHDYKKLYTQHSGVVQEYVHNTKSGLNYYYVKIR